MIQSIDDLKSNIKDIGWNPLLVGGASGLGTYALTRLLGGNKWLAAALGLGVGTGAGWLQYNHNDGNRRGSWSAGYADGMKGTKKLQVDSELLQRIAQTTVNIPAVRNEYIEWFKDDPDLLKRYKELFNRIYEE